MNIASIFNLLLLFSTSILFAAQPPLPPRVPLKAKAAAVLERLELPPSWKPTAPMLVLFESKTEKGTKTIYNGILATNESKGMLKCAITYDSKDDTCNGEVINDRYSRSEWYSHSLEASKARAYYLNMREQDPDQKRRLE